MGKVRVAHAFPRIKAGSVPTEAILVAPGKSASFDFYVQAFFARNESPKIPTVGEISDGLRIQTIRTELGEEGGAQWRRLWCRGTISCEESFNSDEVREEKFAVAAGNSSTTTTVRWAADSPIKTSPRQLFFQAMDSESLTKRIELRCADRDFRIESATGNQGFVTVDGFESARQQTQVLIVTIDPRKAGTARFLRGHVSLTLDHPRQHAMTIPVFVLLGNAGQIE